MSKRHVWKEIIYQVFFFYVGSQFQTTWQMIMPFVFLIIVHIEENQAALSFLTRIDLLLQSW
jgi:hypothetical protein